MREVFVTIDGVKVFRGYNLSWIDFDGLGQKYCAIEHLLKHRAAGHKAPYDRAIDMLRNTTMKIVDGKAVYGWVD